MSLAVGPITQTAVSSTTVSLSSVAASGGTGPYTYQYYASITSGFTPGAGSLVAGATSLVSTITGLTPGTTWYFIIQVTDTGASNATANSAALTSVTSQAVLSQNQFTQVPYIGQVDMPYNTNSWAAQVDSSQVGSLYWGQAVKIVNNLGGIFKVVGCTADTDPVLGFINYDVKSISYVAGSRCEISLAGNVMYMYSTGVIPRIAQVTLDVRTIGGVAAATGSSNDEIVGWSVDQFPAAGSLGRVFIKTPSFTVD